VDPKPDPSDPLGLPSLCRAFLLWCSVRGYSPATVRARDKYLSYFVAWCQERSVLRASEVTRHVLERYERYLYHYRQKNERPLSVRSKYSRLSAIRALFRWLVRQRLILYNPASELELPRIGLCLPKHVLSAAEVEQVLTVPDLKSPIGVRDRALLELLYSTGMRRAELVRLRVEELDRERGTVMIRQAKGKRDRLIPVGRRALLWLNKYLVEARPALVRDSLQGALFVTHRGEPLAPDHLTRHLRRYLVRSGIGKQGACHIFRHTTATLMLENGADIRSIQELLGHAHLSSTQLYTHLSIHKLQRVHAKTHPAEAGAARAAEQRRDEAQQILSSLAAEEELP
jgi:integrase/recombinase XerD